ncbi:hypothetical protein H8959_010385 [Pygathrix nigripes]
MAEAPASPAPLSPLEVELDPEFEPQSRPRSCTWPLQRPELQASPAKPSGETAADSMIPEEEDDEDDEDGGGRAGSAMAIGGGGSGTLGSGLLVEDSARVLAPGGQDPGSGPATAAGALSGGTQALLQPQQPLPPPQPGSAGGSGQPRKCSSRRNAWGNLSYADLITRAIESSPDKRLTLSQIYEWMVRCVPYFKDKGDSNSSAGWKRCRSSKSASYSLLLKCSGASNRLMWPPQSRLAAPSAPAEAWILALFEGRALVWGPALLSLWRLGGGTSLAPFPKTVMCQYQAKESCAVGDIHLLTAAPICNLA